MTDPQIVAKTAALDAVRLAWEAKLLPAVAAKVDDAHAHAAKALTDTLKATQDGRASVLQINRSPSFAAALARLDDAHEWLCGPSEVSTRGKVRDFREAVYREACRLWWPLLAHVTDPPFRSREWHDPTPELVRRARSAVIHGHDPRHWLAGPVETHKRLLKAALERAGKRSTPGHAEDAILGEWATRAAAGITSSLRTLMVDSQTYLDTRAGVELINDHWKEHE